MSAEKLQRLAEELRTLGSVLVAYSGGVDSAFLLWAACRFLGNERVLAVTANSASYPPEELESARSFARLLGLAERHLVVETDEVASENYAQNSPARCYFCKEELYTKLTPVAAQYDIPFIVDGFNASDAGDFRPGKKAADLFGNVKSPLLAAGLTKPEIREIAKAHDLPFWNKPAMACLSSRVPYGQRVTPEKLAQIAQAERFLRSLGFRQFRVRHHEQVARIEVEPEELSRFLDEGIRTAIADRLREIGFLYVTLDLAGYRSGSLNEALALERKGQR